MKLLAALVAAWALRPVGAHAQALDTARGPRIQNAPKGISTTPLMALDGLQAKGLSSVIYLDGQRLDSTALLAVSPSDIATISVMRAETARQLGPDEARLGVLVITTKAGKRKHSVRAFDKRLRKLVPPSAPAAPPGRGPN
ncbi:hypothetical protein QMK33_04855 [Hymenobacter sp. H14-R3]|uniref:hypothetical protein n=1 Tax=Hymenobacter sp. H14-R3 TaxID=3046308 RepID=UPI0024BACFA7|nr:hypothetical protein [Hymenobacter sp. H14-R3]MDJ0364472.1 hypothetical protein [Hymenobacter sp. H14-R3]